MKHTKQQEQAIVINFLFYFFLVGIVVYFFISYIVPNIIIIEQQKQQVVNNYSGQLQKYKKSGIPLEIFKSNISGQTDIYTKQLISGIDKNFYDKYLVNSDKKISYNHFLSILSKQLQDSKQEADDNRKTVEDVLPLYTQGESLAKKGESKEEVVLTDFKFINYVESILETFQLQSSDPVGIKGIEVVDGFDLKSKKQQLFESQIFKIPFQLSISGKKQNVFNFLQYIQGVGNVVINKKSISVEKTPEIRLGKQKVILKGDSYGSDYNIYQHQIADIESISMKEYPDSSYDARNGQRPTIMDLVQGNQANEKIEVSLKLVFYVQGLPFKKLEQTITDMFNQYDIIYKKVKKKKQKIKNSSLEKINITNAFNYLSTIESDISNMKKQLKKKESMNELFKKSKKYLQDIKVINEKISTK